MLPIEYTYLSFCHWQEFKPNGDQALTKDKSWIYG